eukprot:CAMPEP_0172695384 /NCGR_PEP_ID=MMETSP1074-20121228/27318_1 /TAXON_ID=2916 /ORGANISM="Ceratium fusus, Strain PA161109" /LENGTH=107 /DNA_ID=CAMNT_0013516001 /DNA_START=270 /DNA_END=593 /DNA_ORIENTATION=-
MTGPAPLPMARATALSKLSLLTVCGGVACTALSTSVRCALASLSILACCLAMSIFIRTASSRAAVTCKSISLASTAKSSRLPSNPAPRSSCADQASATCACVGFMQS